MNKAILLFLPWQLEMIANRDYYKKGEMSNDEIRLKKIIIPSRSKEQDQNGTIKDIVSLGVRIQRAWSLCMCLCTKRQNVYTFTCITQ